jgi:ABC-type branched-subunit amino acid transport system ATPase component
MTERAQLLRVETLTTGYREMEIVHGVTIEVHPGEMVAIIGPNGSGKSTLLKAIGGLLRSWRGSIFLGQLDITGQSPRQRLKNGVGFVPQSRNTFTNMTVMENLRMGALLSPQRRNERLAKVFEIFPALEDCRSRQAGKLSGGQQQMVAVGRALMGDPSVLLLDEPTAGLAPKLVDELFATIRRITQQGVSALIVEQNAMKALEAADRAYVLANGETQFQGAASEIARDPAVRRLYLGDPGAPPRQGGERS